MIVICWISTTGDFGFNWGGDLREIEADFNGSLLAERDGLRFDDLQWQVLNEQAARRAFNMMHDDGPNAWERAIREYGPFEENV